MSKLPRGFAHLSIFCLLVTLTACSRDSDNNPPSSAQTQAQLVSCYSTRSISNIVGSVLMTHASDEYGSESIIRFDQSFVLDQFDYQAEVGAYVDAVRIYVAKSPVAQFSTVSVLIDGQRLDGDELSIDVPVDGLSKRVEVVFEEEFTNPFYNDPTCDPLFSDTEQTATYRVTYIIDVYKNDSTASLLGPELLSLVSGAGAQTEGSAPLDAGDEFGAAVALYGDTLVIAAPGDDNGEPTLFGSTRIVEGLNDSSVKSYLASDNSLPDSGAVYVFNRDSTGVWSLSHLLKARFPDEGDRFGESVALQGDLLVISAPNEDSNARGVNGIANNNTAPNSGAVYIFRRDVANDTWTEVAYLKAFSNSGGVDGFADGFGSSIAVSDGMVLVGAPEEEYVSETDTVYGAGRAYLYRSSDNIEWSTSQSFRAPLPGQNDNFGASVALSASRIIIGAPGDSLLERRENDTPSNIFDARTVVQGDNLTQWFDSDKYSYDRTLTTSGAAYYYESEANSFSLVAFLKASNADSGDRFGTSVALGANRLLFVGAPFEDSDGAGLNREMSSNLMPNSGAMYAYQSDESLSNWSLKYYVKGRVPQQGGLFGSSIAYDSGLLALGSPEVIVSETSSKGVAELYRLKSGEAEFIESYYVYDEFLSSEERFGQALSVSNGQAAISAPGLNQYLFDLAGIPVEVQQEVGRVLLVE